MQAEIEVRFPNADYTSVRRRLNGIGATCVAPMHSMRRVIIDYPDRRLQIGQEDVWGFIRVRDDGKKVTLTYKQVAKTPRMDTHEIEVEVSSFEKAIEIFEAAGLKNHSEQHTKREDWSYQDCQITLDEWPWLEPMVEIEGPDEPTVRKVAEALGFGWRNAMRGNAQDVYARKYPGIKDGESISQIPKLTFAHMPAWLKERK